MLKQILSNAILIATQKHDGVFDKGGNPYILHPLKVMHYLKTDDEELMAIAVLHDVVEDTDTTYEELYAAGMTPRVIDALTLLTKVPGQTHREYVDGLKTNVDAMRVKLCDLRHNSDIRRIKNREVTEKDIARVVKYQKMHLELTNELRNRGII